jgi:tetratricopeptide (TPR) repeat protein
MRNDMAVSAAQSQGDSANAFNDWNQAAEKYLEALRLQEKQFGLDSVRARQLLRMAVEALSRAGKIEEANKLVSQRYFPAQGHLAQRALEHNWLYWRGSQMARQKHWREARDDITLVLKYEQSHAVYDALAPLLVAQRDITAYQQLCREMVARFAGTKDIFAADRISRDCLILPSSGTDLDAVAALAETAVTKGKGQFPYTFFLCSKALADYRQGKFQQAVSGALEILKDPFPHTQAEGRAVLAMALFQLGNAEEARTALAGLEKVVQEKLPSPESDLGSDWEDWIIAHALLDEARNLIAGPTSAKLDWH